MCSVSHQTRGVRNCNPLNIRVGCRWIGERAVNNDGVFEQFASMLYGLRAAFILLRRYIQRYRLDTICKIISRWAPENPHVQQIYIDYVAMSAKIDADKTIFWSSRDVLEIVRAMCWFESHYRPSDDELLHAYRLAGGDFD